MANNFVKYAELLTVNGVNLETDKEKFVFLPEDGEYIVSKYEPTMMMTGNCPRLAVRKTVAEKLENVGKRLKELEVGNVVIR